MYMVSFVSCVIVCQVAHLLSHLWQTKSLAEPLAQTDVYRC